MKENEISELIESDNGFHILSLKNIQSEETKNYSDVKNSILILLFIIDSSCLFIRSMDL